MRKYFLIFLLLVLTLNVHVHVHAQTNDLKNFNGWEFLEWSWNKTQVEETLKSKGIKFDPGHPNQKQGPTTTLNYMGMETRLAYDMPHLYDVQQYKYFAEGEGDNANAFYHKLLAEFMDKYGIPASYENNKTEQQIEILWKLKYTKIGLHYNYEGKNKYFKDQSYSIAVFANEI